MQEVFPSGIGWFKNSHPAAKLVLTQADNGTPFWMDDGFNLLPSYRKHLVEFWSPGHHLPLKDRSLLILNKEFLSTVPKLRELSI